jgi:hypothetical protein
MPVADHKAAERLLASAGPPTAPKEQKSAALPTTTDPTALLADIPITPTKSESAEPAAIHTAASPAQIHLVMPSDYQPLPDEKTIPAAPPTTSAITPSVDKQGSPLALASAPSTTATPSIAGTVSTFFYAKNLTYPSRINGALLTPGKTQVCLVRSKTDHDADPKLYVETVNTTGAITCTVYTLLYLQDAFYFIQRAVLTGEALSNLQHTHHITATQLSSAQSETLPHRLQEQEGASLAEVSDSAVDWAQWYAHLLTPAPAAISTATQSFTI